MRESIQKAYEQLERATPLRGDCGKLCGAHCCKGSANTGMELFCGERELFEGRDGFEIKSVDGRDILICSGKCERKMRPLACRIYPLFPAVRCEDGKVSVSVVRDIRGVSSCPLVYGAIKPDPRFVIAVRRAAKYLVRDEDNLQRLCENTALLDELAELSEKMMK